MAVVTAANVVLAFGDRHVLDGANLTLAPGEHVGMVGRNGCGKSTLMKLIAGLGGLKPQAGQIQVARGATVGYLHQDPDLDADRTLRQEAGRAFDHLNALHAKLDGLTHDMAEASGDALERLLKQYEQVEHEVEAAGGYAVDHKIEATLHGVGLGDETFDVPVSGLSGGQRGRLALAKLLLSEPDVLLLDEPTNHLDIAGRQWLEEYLTGYGGAVIVISHDRWLLNRAVTKIYEIEEGRVYEYPGNYDQYRELRAERRAALLRQYEKQQEKVKREQAYIDRYRAGQRSRQAKGREKRLDRFRRDDMMDRPIEQGDVAIRMRPVPRCSEQVITAEHVRKAYDGVTLFNDVTITIKRGDRIGVIGPNGAGKSTLVRCLIGEQAADGGTSRIGSGVELGHYRQTHEHMNLDATVVEYLQRFVPNETEQEARDLAGAFLFSGLDQDKPLGVLSGGERSRAALAGLVVAGHNVLVLDEPTNHLDIPSAERLEDALRHFTRDTKGYGQNALQGGGTLILITHDRMLLDDLVDQLIVLDGLGGAKHFLGTYSDYIESLRAAVRQDTTPKPQPKPRNKSSKKKGKTTKTESTPGARAKRKQTALSLVKQEDLEARIEKIEGQIEQVDAQLADPDTYRDPEKAKKLQLKREELAADLEPLEEEWMARAEP